MNVEKRYRNIIPLIVLLLSIALPGYAQTPIEKFVANPAICPDKSAVLITDLKSGKTIVTHNAKIPLVPASINKAVTIATTLNHSGADYKYNTQLYLSGDMEGDTLCGNLVVKGGGDPTLGTKEATKRADIIAQIVSAVKLEEIKVIQGKIIVDESIFAGPATSPGWASDDLNYAYGTGCHGLNWQHNASGNKAVRNPSATFVSALTAALQRAGITILNHSVDADMDDYPVLEYSSGPISDIMRYCMKESDNLYAETLLRTTALLSGKSASTAEGAAVETKYWKDKGSPMADVKIVDGSGLARSNRLTATFLTDVLRRMSGNAKYLSFFPLVGVEGTVKSFMKDTRLKEYLALKTGSMRGIQCYAGYLLNDKYVPTHTVVVIMNDLPGDRSNAKNAVQELLLETFPNAGKNR